MSGVRILIVDDAREWREFISTLLMKEKRFEIAGEAQDGSHAIHVATRVKPCVILLDIQMPKLNGLEAAKRIRVLEPAARIVFVTGEDDHHIVAAAFEIGASGYVLKARASRDLIDAVDEAIRGNRFVSDGLLPRTSLEPDRTNRNRHNRSSIGRQKGPLRFSFAHN